MHAVDYSYVFILFYEGTPLVCQQLFAPWQRSTNAERDYYDFCADMIIQCEKPTSVKVWVEWNMHGNVSQM